MWKRICLCVALTMIATVAYAEIRVGGYKSSSRSSYRSGGTMYQRPAAMTPTWDYRNRSGYEYMIRQRPFTPTPTYDWQDNRGNRGTIRQRPFSSTWDFD